MGRLVECALEIVEVLSTFLGSRHLARLYMTGDGAFGKTLRELRSRTCVLPALLGGATSSLVTTLLIGRAAAIQTSLIHVDMSVLATPLRIRHLQLDHYNDGATTTLAVTDFSALTTLEKLKIGSYYVVVSPLTLPSSLTRLELGAVCCARPVCDLDAHASLRSLTMRFAECDDGSVNVDDEQRQFFATVQWPPQLTSLNVNICEPFNIIADVLPSNLTRLVLSRDEDAGMDLSAMIARQTRLEYLKINEGPVHIEKPLPASLQTLYLNGLYIKAGQSAFDVFSLMPASMTRFSTYYITAADDDDVTYDDYAADVERAWMFILPRLKIRCQEAALRIIQQMIERVSDAFMQWYTSLMEKHRLGAGYVSRLIQGSDGNHNSIGLASICRLLNVGVPAASMPYVIDGGPIYSGYFHSTDPTYVPSRNETYASAVCQLLELGYTDRFNISKCSEQDLVANPLSDAAVHNLRTLVVSCDSVAHLEVFLGVNKLDSVVEIDIPDHVTTDTIDALLKVIHHCRARMPVLEEIYFSTLHHVHKGLPVVARATQRLMAEMGLRAKGLDASFLYCTGYGVAAFDVEQTSMESQV